MIRTYLCVFTSQNEATASLFFSIVPLAPAPANCNLGLCVQCTEDTALVDKLLDDGCFVEEAGTSRVVGKGEERVQCVLIEKRTFRKEAILTAL